MHGKTLLIGESCWWGSSSDSEPLFAVDKAYKFNSWKDVYKLTYKHALEYGFNTLDLREVPETQGWTTKAHDLVQGFISKGGYRLYPSTVTLPVVAKKDNKVQIEHSWKNMGTGYLPNNVKNWNYKYKPAFALLNNENKIIKLYIDPVADPSLWLGEKEYSYTLPITFEGVPPGDYKWAIAIVDQSQKNIPGIRLAITIDQEINGWYVLDKFSLIQ